MLDLTEEYLARKEVTKGARKKIILCIQKIKERHSTLQQLEKEVLQLGRLQYVLAELKVILMSPIKMPTKKKKPTPPNPDQTDEQNNNNNNNNNNSDNSNNNTTEDGGANENSPKEGGGSGVEGGGG